MFITDKNELKKYTAENRIWQGIPSIEVTKGGRIFSTFYSGKTKETLGNYVMLLKSDDGVSFSEPIAVAYGGEHSRCFDPTLWIDPQGRLWFMWATMPETGLCGVICNDPDSDELSFSEVMHIGYNVMMNRPTVLSTGEWLFPIAVWKDEWRNILEGGKTRSDKTGAFAYQTTDCGKTFRRLGCACAPERSFDEHMLLEKTDGSIAMYIRTTYGIAVSYSYDKGETWSEPVDSKIPGPCSRFHIRRLKSGRILMVNHHNFNGRNNLTAFLSEDDGNTWKYQLLLDGRDNVSYPDAKEADDGYIYITYDRERGGFLNSMSEVYAAAREILYAKITEEDIIAGKLISPKSRLKCIISKLGKYAKEAENPYHEPDKYTDIELAEFLVKNHPECIVSKIFEYYPVNCVNMQKLANKKLDSLITDLEDAENKLPQALNIITLVRSVSETKVTATPIVERIKEIIAENLSCDLTSKEVADKVGISLYYMLHHFKKQTGKTITDYKNETKITEAKRLLAETDLSISEIADACGFCSASYFAEVFTQLENISPSVYKKYLRQQITKNNDCEAFGLCDDKAKVLFNMLPHKKLLSNIKVSHLKPNPDACTDYEVYYPEPGFEFLHESAIIEFGGRLFAAWYNNGKLELTGRTPIRFATSDDGGKTWSAPKTVADDPSGKILFCPPVFGIDDGKLYMFINQMVSPDHMHSFDLYVYNEDTNAFDMLWSRPIPFKLNTNVYKLSNGKLMLPGRIAEMDCFPNTPAVMISDSGKIDDQWRLVKIAENGDLPNGEAFVHPELSAIVDGETVYIFSRNDKGAFPILYISKDNGETWSEAHSVDMPLSDTKIYSGTLSDGRNYIIGNTYPGRSKLVILFTEPGKMKFTKGFVLQDEKSEKLGYGTCWHYPVAYEANGKLYVIYTFNLESFTKRGAALSVIDIDKI